MEIRPNTIATWFNILRENPEMLPRFSECFWESQLKSKEIIVQDVFNTISTDYPGCIYIFGGWYGILAQLLNDSYLTQKIYTIDVDPHCEEIISKYFNVPVIESVTCDMADFRYVHHPDIVINTSTEHVSQKVFSQWWTNIPTGTFYILQGNNLTIPEHIRTARDIGHFIEINHCRKHEFQNVTQCPGPDGMFERYTVAGYK